MQKDGIIATSKEQIKKYLLKNYSIKIEDYE